MTGVPVEVLAQRVANALQEATAYNDAGDCEKASTALFSARAWLNQLREAMR